MVSTDAVDLYSFLFHFGGFALYVGNYIYEKNYVVTPGSETYAGRWKYLTFWNEMIQLFYFTLATLVDISSMVMKHKRKNFSHQLKDFLFSTITFPMALFVSLTFWSIYSIDREMIYPAELDKLIPSLVNHILHTFCSLLMILEAFIVHHQYPARRTGLLTIAFFSLLYFIWMAWQAHVLLEWPYPFLASFSVLHHCIFYAICYGLLCFLFFIGQYITKVVEAMRRDQLKNAKR